MDTWERLSQRSGMGAVVVTLGTIFLATLVSPAFAWSGNALSNLGVTGTAAGTGLTVVLFNGGLILGGLVGLAFALALARSAVSLGERVTAGSLGLALVFMALVGVFPQDTDPHFPVAASFYLLISVTLWLDSVAAFRQGWRQRAGIALSLGTANLAGWLVWGLTGSPLRDGLAIPELWGALCFSVWTAWVSLGLVRGRWDQSGPGAGV